MKENKFILTGTDNNGFRHRYSVKKIEEFKPAFIKFMADLGFGEKCGEGLFLSNDKNGDSIVLKVSDFEDECKNFNNGKYDLDVFFGRFRIIFVIRTKERAPMVEHLEKEANWIKHLEIKKLKKEKKIKIPVQKMRNIK